MKTKLIPFLILAFGFFLGRLSMNSLHKKETKSEIVHTESKKEQVSTLGTSQKDSTLSQEMNYTEKFYNAKGILTREITKNSSNRASASQGTTIELKTVSDMTSASIEKVTTIETYQSNWKVGIIFPTQNIYEPKNFMTDSKNINAIVGYRIFDNLEIIGMTNYKFQTQVGLMIGF